MFDPIDIGWMAGILDGEGSIVLVQNSAVRKSDGRRSVMPRIYMAVTDFEILERYTQILSKWGIAYTYTTLKYNVESGDWSPKVNVNIHRHDAVIKLLEIVLPHLTTKKARAELILEYTKWRQEHSEELNYRGGPIDTSCQDIEQEFWRQYREIYAGRGRKKILARKRDLREAILLPNTPIYFPD